MNMHVPARIWVSLILVAAVAALGAGDEPRELAGLREKYNQQVRGAMQPVLQNYARDLENLLVRVTQQRDLEAAARVRAELDQVKGRLAQMATEPFFPSPGTVVRQAADSNRVESPGFEGSTDGWVLWGLHPTRTKADLGEKQAHAGRYCLRMRREEGRSLAGAVQDLHGRFRPGDHVHASAWVRTGAGPANGVVFGVSLKDAADKELQTVVRPAAGAGGWERLAFDFVIPTRDQAPGLARVHLFVAIQGKEDPGDVYVDDVYAGLQPPPP